jgi:enoyl-CoA hydratase/carnithine racemase
MARLINEA